MRYCLLLLCFSTGCIGQDLFPQLAKPLSLITYEEMTESLRPQPGTKEIKHYTTQGGDRYLTEVAQLNERGECTQTLMYAFNKDKKVYRTVKRRYLDGLIEETEIEKGREDYPYRYNFFEFNEHGLLTKFYTVYDGDTTLRSTWTHNERDQLIKAEYRDGGVQVDSFCYKVGGRLEKAILSKSYSNSPHFNEKRILEYHYNKEGQLTKRTESNNEAQTRYYSYKGNQVVKEKNELIEISYDYHKKEVYKQILIETKRNQNTATRSEINYDKQGRRRKITQKILSDTKVEEWEYLR